MVQVVIGLGSNLGDPEKQIKRAIRRIDDIQFFNVRKMSSLYLTRPVGPVKQPNYVNAVITVDTFLTPGHILNRMFEIESSLGRHRDGVKWGPRIIDLDLLLYNNKYGKERNLTYPHPELHKRKFVLVPMKDVLEEGWKHPLLYLTIPEMLTGLNGQDDPVRI